MADAPLQVVTARCVCGATELALEGAPILTAVCYCDACQLAAKAIETLERAPKITDAAGGTPLALYRRDRMRIVKGEETLQDFRLSARTPTRRRIATCCDAMMYLDFSKGHWVSVHRDRLAPGDRPQIEMRVQTRYVAEGVMLPEGGKVYRKWPLRFLGRLLKAQIAMILGR
ncbi:MAG: hypothetical protein QM698_12120 [Micropepsaceae bacterium]